MLSIQLMSPGMSGPMSLQKGFFMQSISILAAKALPRDWERQQTHCPARSWTPAFFPPSDSVISFSPVHKRFLELPGPIFGKKIIRLGKVGVFR